MKIAFVSQPEYFRFMYENDLDCLGEIYEFSLHYGMDEKEFKPLIDFCADYNFCFRGEFIPESVLNKLSGVKISLSSEPFPRVIDEKLEYTLDSINRYLTFRPIREMSYDYIFHYDEASLAFLEKDGLFLSGAFPFPVATGSYFKKDEIKSWDFFFIGRSSVHREIFFAPLKHRFNFLHICHGIWGPELNHYINRSKICLNVHAENEISWEPRLQMLLATGAFVISEQVTGNKILRPGIDYVEANSSEEMFELVSHYLKNDDERSKISESGRLRVLDMLDSKKCFSELLELINEGKCKQFSKISEKKFQIKTNIVQLKIRKIFTWLKQKY